MGIRSSKCIDRDEAIKLLLDRINDPAISRMVLEDMLNAAYADGFENFVIAATPSPVTPADRAHAENKGE